MTSADPLCGRACWITLALLSSFFIYRYTEYTDLLSVFYLFFLLSSFFFLHIQIYRIYRIYRKGPRSRPKVQGPRPKVQIFCSGGSMSALKSGSPRLQSGPQVPPLESFHFLHIQIYRIYRSADPPGVERVGF